MASTISCISSIEAAIPSRVSASSTISARTRSAVSGERKSCASAASICVRSVTKRASRLCIPLNAAVSSRTSKGPTGAIGSCLAPRPISSAASANSLSGRVKRVRTYQKITNRRTTAVEMNESVDAQDHCIGGRSNRVATLSQFPPEIAIETSISIAASVPRIISACICAISGDKFGNGSRPCSISCTSTRISRLYPSFSKARIRASTAPFSS